MLCLCFLFSQAGDISGVFSSRDKAVCVVSRFVCGVVVFSPKTGDISGVCQWQNWMLLFFPPGWSGVCQWQNWMLLFFPQAGVVFASGRTGCVFPPQGWWHNAVCQWQNWMLFPPPRLVTSVVFASGRTRLKKIPPRLKWCLPVAELDVCCHCVIVYGCFYFPSGVCQWQNWIFFFFPQGWWHLWFCQWQNWMFFLSPKAGDINGVCPWQNWMCVVAVLLCMPVFISRLVTEGVFAPGDEKWGILSFCVMSCSLLSLSQAGDISGVCQRRQSGFWQWRPHRTGVGHAKHEVPNSNHPHGLGCQQVCFSWSQEQACSWGGRRNYDNTFETTATIMNILRDPLQDEL